MDYKQIRNEIYNFIKTLSCNIQCIADESKKIYKEIKNDDTITIDTINLIDNFMMNIKELHEFCNKYDVDVLKCIDYKCTDITEIEKKLFEDEYEYELYVEQLIDFKNMFIDHLDENIEKLNKSSISLSKSEFMYSLMLSYMNSISIEEDDRERFGYIIKMILDEYEYKLYRNALLIFYDDFMYNDLIRNKYRFV